MYFEQKNADIFAKFFGENILKIITSVPREKRQYFCQIAKIF
jgi:hypothetical protein